MRKSGLKVKNGQTKLSVFIASINQKLPFQKKLKNVSSSCGIFLFMSLQTAINWCKEENLKPLDLENIYAAVSARMPMAFIGKNLQLTVLS